VFLPHGNVLICITDGQYLDKRVDGAVGGRVLVVECRHVRRYRGASVLDMHV
jgi:hypothetical protein